MPGGDVIALALRLENVRDNGLVGDAGAGSSGLRGTRLGGPIDPFPGWEGVGDVREADRGDMLAAIDAAFSAAIGRVDVNLGANGGQAFGIALEREAFFDQLLAEAARPERVIGMVSDTRHLIEKADILIAA